MLGQLCLVEIQARQVMAARAFQSVLPRHDRTEAHLILDADRCSLLATPALDQLVDYLESALAVEGER